jgi:zinc D-Ala-D-Ala carboxypeptidase
VLVSATLIGGVEWQAPGEADGAVPAGLTVFDDDVPAVANLDPRMHQ